MKKNMKIYSRKMRATAIIALVSVLFEIAFPSMAYGLTGGPSQPEVQSFEPVGTTDMVDLFSGDFTYNIPLLDIEGYPVNISYHAGVQMDQEASWVGLGWNINPGVINRGLNGLPDDFKGDIITKETNIKKDLTIGLVASVGTNDVEMFGVKIGDKVQIGLGASLGMIYNNYKGIGFEMGVNPSVTIGDKTGPAITAGLGMGYSSLDGASVSPSLNVAYNKKTKDEESIVGGSIGVGTSVNSRTGLKSMVVNAGIHATDERKNIPKKEKQSGSNLGTSTHPIIFGSRMWSPEMPMAMKNKAASYKGSVGIEAFAGSDIRLGLMGYKTLNWLQITKKDFPGFGLMYAGEDMFPLQSLKDFQRENSSAFIENAPNLPPAFHTGDYYSVSGQGIGGVYKLKRGDIGMTGDPESLNGSFSESVGVELSVVNVAKAGANISKDKSISASGMWTNTNHLGRGFKPGRTYYDGTPDKELINFEAAYFMRSGELSAYDNEFFNRIYHDQIVSPVPTMNSEPMTHADNYPPPSNRMKVMYDNVSSAPTLGKTVKVFKKTPLPLAVNGESKEMNTSGNFRKVRQKRNENISYLEGNRAHQYGFNRYIYSYYENSSAPGGTSTLIPHSIVRNTGNRKGHHLSELTVTQSDGSRYVYGIPAYNNKQIEKTFNVGGTSPPNRNCQTGQVIYSADQKDNTKDNSKGIDHYYDATFTPPYAHSYLLTEILSQDYVDVGGNGVTDDDLGNAVKFNYTRVHENYKWRVPYNHGAANYSEGLKSDNNDDKASYVYGEKEIWYLHSVESKNYIAFFCLGSRQDGFGVGGENGGKDINQNLRKLEKIILYSKQDYKKNKLTAVPIKTVHFEYDYSLCPGIENGTSGGGKLTLKKIYFTHGSSGKGKLTPYRFEYNQYNPSYNLKGYDRWGTYKPNVPSSSCAVDGALGNVEFPYTPQDTELAAQYASAWSLQTIHLPSGGRINIELEADDYAFVQDKRAMEMFMIAGFSKDNNAQNTGDLTDLLYKHTITSELNLYMYFELKEAITNDEKGRLEFYNRYLGGGKKFDHVQVSVLVDINNAGSFEYVRLYPEVDHAAQNWFGLSDNGQLGWIKLKGQPYSNKDNNKEQCHPIAKGAWNFARINAPQIIYPHSYNNQFSSYDADTEDMFLKLNGFAHEIQSIFNGFYRTCSKHKYASKVKLNKSWMRLFNPDGKKIGGGHRVKKIVMNDNWETMGSMNTEAANMEYGQEYLYETTSNSIAGEQSVISSGVATYEPIAGAEENPFYQPMVTTQHNVMIPNAQFLRDQPWGESMFPSPSVGYSKVEVKSIGRENVKRNATGKQVTEFYTARDFPFKVSFNMIEPAKERTSVWKGIIKGDAFDHMAVGQGYVIELNDMHGKLKAQHTYAESKPEPISSVIHHYKTEPGNRRSLYNKVLAIDPKGNIDSITLGVDIEVNLDTRASATQTDNYTQALNTDFGMAGTFPIFFLTLFPENTSYSSSFHSAVMTKVVTRHGILERTEAFQEGAGIKTENLLHDSETGEVLLTSVENEFNDKVYNYTFPAHWAYDQGMGQAYKNSNVSILIFTGHDTIAMAGGLKARDFLVPGDECIISPLRGNNYYKKVWVYEGSGNKLNLIDKRGRSITQDFDGNNRFLLTVLRSGRRNMPSTPIGTIVTLKNPLVKNGENYQILFDSIINAGAIEFDQRWQALCGEIPNTNCFFNIAKIQSFLNHVNYITDTAKHHLHNIMYNFSSLRGWLWFDDEFETSNPRYVFTHYDNYINYEEDEDIQLDIPLPYDALMNALYGRSFRPTLDNDELVFFKKVSGIYSPISGFYNFKSDNIFVYDSSLSDYVPFTVDTVLRLKNHPDEGFHYIANFVALESSFWRTFSYTKSQNFEIISYLYSSYQYPYYNISGKTTDFRIRYGAALETGVIDSFVPVTCDVHFSLYGTDSFPLPDTLYHIDSLIRFMEFNPIDNEHISAKAQIRMADGSIDTMRYMIQFDPHCFNLEDCFDYCISDSVGVRVNPYVTGILGNWRPKREYVYQGERNYAGDDSDVRKGGTFKTFNSFWKLTGTGDNKKYTPYNPYNRWIWSTEITKYSPFGQELENRDALNRYSAALYSYNHTLPIAVGDNTKYERFAYDGFEHYDYLHSPKPCENDHWSFKQSLSDSVKRVSNVRHSGRYSLKILPGAEAGVGRSSIPCMDSETPPNDTTEHKLLPCDCIGRFTPSTGRYVLSGWVKDSVSASDTTYAEPSIVVYYFRTSGYTTQTFKASGFIIDGWQKIDGTFEVDEEVEFLEVRLVASTTTVTWFDDIRVFPFEGNMKSFAYDPVTLRLLAELDDNNYATFYEYDQEGALIRVKKETQDGIVTLKEARNKLIKENVQ